MTVRQDRADVEEAVATVLADGGNVDDELDAARAVLAALGGVEKVQWRIVCSLHGTDSRHKYHAYTKPSAVAAFHAMDATNNDPVAKFEWRAPCLPWSVQATVVFGWDTIEGIRDGG